LIVLNVKSMSKDFWLLFFELKFPRLLKSGGFMPSSCEERLRDGTTDLKFWICLSSDCALIDFFSS